MADPVWLCLFKADFTDKNNIKGDLRVKIKLADLSHLAIDTKEPKKLVAPLVLNSQAVSLMLIFDNQQRAKESFDFMKQNRDLVG